MLDNKWGRSSHCACFPTANEGQGHTLHLLIKDDVVESFV